MGSAEFEWGALPMSLAVITRIPVNDKEPQFHKIYHRSIIPLLDLGTPRRVGSEDELSFIFPPEFSTELCEHLCDQFLRNLGHDHMRTKEAVRLKQYFYATTPEPMRVVGRKKVPSRGYSAPVSDFWWDIRNHFMVFPLSREAQVLEALSALQSRNFSENWEKNNLSQRPWESHAIKFFS